MEHYQWHKQNPDGYCLYCGGDPKDLSDYEFPKTSDARCICGVLKSEHHASLDGHAFSEKTTRPADNLRATQAIEPIRQLLKLSGSRGRDNNWLLSAIAEHVSKFTPLG